MMRRLWFRIAVGVVVLSGATTLVDVPTLVGPHKGDEATFVAMALSLAHDGDLEYTPVDFDRFKALYGRGPDGIFLKRGHDVGVTLQAAWPPIQVIRVPMPADQRLEFSKSFAFAVFAAPFVAAFGLSGILLMNTLLLVAVAVCSVAFARARCGPIAGTIIGLAFWAATVVPVYLVWLTPEILNVALVGGGLFFWLYKEVAPSTAWAGWRAPWTDWMAAFLIGIATFSKPPNAVFIAPVACVLLYRRQWRVGLIAAAMFLVGSAGNFGLNALATGHWNYQGGDRKSFYTSFPFDGTGYTYDSLERTMATDGADADMHLAPDRLRAMLPSNIRYFFFGQYAGLFPFFFPGAAILVMFLWRWRDATLWQWLLLLACGGGALVLLVLTPNSWSGGGGPVGNRYFISLYPALLFLLPTGLRVWSAAAIALVGLICMGPVLARPAQMSQEPWRIGEHWPLRVLPVELTLLDDSPARLLPSRGRIPFRINSFVLMYYMDGNSYSPEPAGGIAGAPTDGFWIAGDRTARIGLRSSTPLTSVTFTVWSREPNTFMVDMQGRAASVSLAAGQTGTLRLIPGDPVYIGTSYAYVWTMSTTAGFVPAEIDPDSADTRNLGVFVKPVFEAQPAPGQTSAPASTPPAASRP
jgi:hypothetical protein